LPSPLQSRGSGKPYQVTRYFRAAAFLFHILRNPCGTYTDWLDTPPRRGPQLPPVLGPCRFVRTANRFSAYWEQRGLHWRNTTSCQGCFRFAGHSSRVVESAQGCRSITVAATHVCVRLVAVDRAAAPGWSNSLRRP